MVIDPISDMLTRIRNAVTKKHKNVLIPSSKFKVEIAKILQNEGFINSFQIIKNGTTVVSLGINDKFIILEEFLLLSKLFE